MDIDIIYKLITITAGVLGIIISFSVFIFGQKPLIEFFKELRGKPSKEAELTDATTSKTNRLDSIAKPLPSLKVFGFSWPLADVPIRLLAGLTLFWHLILWLFEIP